MINKACKRLIDSVWTMTFQTIDDGTVKVLAYNREDEDGYKYEEAMAHLDVVEDDDRIVRGIGLNGVYYNVANPKYIFSY